MNLLFPFLAIVGVSASRIVDKLNFTRNRIAPKQIMLLAFFAMSLSLLIFITITRQPFPDLQLPAVSLLALIALTSFGGNLFDFLSLKSDDLSLREPLSDFEPMIAGLVGYLLFPEERQTGFLIAFILGAATVYWGSHQRKLRRLQKQGMSYFLLATLLYALLPSMYKLALNFVTPEYIAFFRSSAILLLTLIFLRPKSLRVFSAGRVKYGFASGLLYAIAAVASLYAIQTLGVVLTMLLLLTGPILRYLGGYFILREKVRRGEVVSSFLLAAIVLIAVWSN